MTRFGSAKLHSHISRSRVHPSAPARGGSVQLLTFSLSRTASLRIVTYCNFSPPPLPPPHIVQTARATTRASPPKKRFDQKHFKTVSLKRAANVAEKYKITGPSSGKFLWYFYVKIEKLRL